VAYKRRKLGKYEKKPAFENVKSTAKHEIVNHSAKEWVGRGVHTRKMD
jgi:hypothetical protein